MTPSQTPTYNLSAVLRATGLVADTLRAWERRYGVPKPRRTQGGQRLYSENDIELIKWLRSRQAEGLSISRAVGEWRDLVARGADPLEQTIAPVASVQGAFPSPVLAGLESLRDQWLAACLSYDEAAAEQVLSLAFAQYSMETVAAEIIGPALHEIGEMWIRGQASVQQEHFLSALATRRCEVLISASPPAVHQETILLACAENELHAWPLLHLALLLRRRGWNVRFLGASVPTAQLNETAAAVHAAVVVLGAERLVSAVALRASARHLASIGIPVVFGGRVFDALHELRQQIPGVYAGGMQEAIDWIERLAEGAALGSAPLPVVAGAPALAYRRARRLIEAEALQALGALEFPEDLLEAANQHLGASIAAAIEFGGAEYLGVDIDAIPPTLRSLGLSVSVIRRWLENYAGAMRRVLGHQGDVAAQILEACAARQDVGEN